MPRWMVYSILTLLFWGAWGVLGKALGDALTPFESQALSTLALVPLIAVLARRAKRPRGGRGLLYAFVSGLFAGGGNIAYYYALAAGGAASTVTPLTALYPIVTILLAVLFLREKMSLAQLAGIFLALASIYLFNYARVESGGIAYALLPIALWGVSAFFQKLSTNHLSSELSTLAFWIAFLPIAGFIFLTQPVRWSAPALTWVWVLLLGTTFGVGNLTLLAAYGSGGKASIVTPLCGLYSMVTLPLAILFLDERIGFRDGGGIVLALAAVVALSIERPAAELSPTAST